MTLLEMIKNYQELLQLKDELNEKTEKNNADIKKAKEKIVQQMIDDDCPSIAYGEYNYSLQHKTSYTKISEEELSAKGVDFLKTLVEEGFGSLITQRVDPRTLQSAVNAYVEENGRLSEGLASIVNEYEFNDISRRKMAKKKGGKKQ